MNHADARRLARLSLGVALLLVTLEHAVTRVFVLNFSTTGPNATALLALLLLTGWTLPVVGRLDPPYREPLLVGLTAAGIAVSLLGGPVLALLGAALAGLALTPLLVVDAGELRERTGSAFALGLLLVLALRGVDGAAPAYATDLGVIALLGLLLALSVVTVSLRAASRPVERVPHAAPLFAAVFLAVLWLGAPATPARWAGRPYLPAVALAALGLLLGATWLEARGRPTVGVVAGSGLLLLGSLAALLTGSVPAVVALAPALAALVVVTGTAGLGETTPARVGLGVLAVQFAGLLATVGFVFAVNFAFVPGGAAFQGAEPALVLALGGVVALAAVLVARGSALAAERVPLAPDPDRRALLAGVTAGLVGVAGAFLRRPRTTATPTELRVATYNLHQWVDADGAYNLRAVARLLREQEASVVGLQETEGARVTAGHVHGVRWLAERLGYHWHPGPDTGTGGYGVALLSAWPLSDVEWVELPRTDSAVRVAMRATVEHPDGPFRVVNAHLETGGEVRVQQAERVKRMVTGADRAVVLGDFNATPEEAAIATMTDSFTDAWAAAGEGDGDTYSASDPFQRIDYVFVRGFSVPDASVFGSAEESDHRGVAATLERD